jgi:hypothetical protein
MDAAPRKTLGARGEAYYFQAGMYPQYLIILLPVYYNKHLRKSESPRNSTRVARSSEFSILFQVTHFGNLKAGNNGVPRGS